MYNTDKITTRILFKNMDLISRRNERAQNDYLKEMGRLNFERRRELLFLFINLMRQLDILRYM